MKKLRRGLHDLSPLFQSTDPAPPAAEPSRLPSSVQFLAVCAPDHEGDAFFANAFIASQLVRQDHRFATLVSIVPGMNAGAKAHEPFPALELLDSKISRLSLTHEEVWSFTRNGHSSPPPSEVGGLAHFLIFLEFEPSKFRSLSQIALLLDRVILLVQPVVEGLREAYRMMKILWTLNREIEFFLLFRDEQRRETEEGFLFERFSLIASRFLGTSPGWLGHLAFPRKSPDGASPTEGVLQFNPELLLASEGLKRPLSPEKDKFWRRLQEILQRRLQPDFTPVTP